MFFFYFLLNTRVYLLLEIFANREKYRPYPSLLLADSSSISKVTLLFDLSQAVRHLALIGSMS